MMQGKQIKGQFIWRTGLDRQAVVDEIKDKIENGYFTSSMVTSELVDKLAPSLNSILES